LRSAQVKLRAADATDRNGDGAYIGVIVQVEAVMGSKHCVDQGLPKLDKILLRRYKRCRNWQRIDQAQTKRGIGWLTRYIKETDGEVAEQAAIDYSIEAPGAIVAQDRFVKEA